jgi:hypothetical protein
MIRMIGGRSHLFGDRLLILLRRRLCVGFSPCSGNGAVLCLALRRHFLWIGESVAVVDKEAGFRDAFVVQSRRWSVQAKKGCSNSETASLERC